MRRAPQRACCSARPTDSCLQVRHSFQYPVVKECSPLYAAATFPAIQDCGAWLAPIMRGRQSEKPGPCGCVDGPGHAPAAMLPRAARGNREARWWCRARHERERPRTRERALLALQQLAEAPRAPWPPPASRLMRAPGARA